MEKSDLKIISGKCQVQYLIPSFLWEVGEVLSHGNKKYAPQNWQWGEHRPLEYIGAALRHLLKYWAGEKLDAETGLSHLAHATASLMFIFWYDNGDALTNRVCQCPMCNKA